VHALQACSRKRGGLNAKLCHFVRAQVSYLHHRELVKPVLKRSNEKIAYYRIAAHYRFILRTFFDCFKFPRLIILEASLHAHGTQSSMRFALDPASTFPLHDDIVLGCLHAQAPLHGDCMGSLHAPGPCISIAWGACMHQTAACGSARGGREGFVKGTHAHALLQDDMDLAPDFFPYFETLAPMLDADAGLMCISSWNDHGQVRKIRRPLHVYRWSLHCR
jgi:hypothetical protein